jgi:hypothetical protein
MIGNSSKENFGKWKKESQIIILARENAEKYYHSVEFRETTLKYIESPRLQLELNFDEKEICPVLDLQLLNNLRKLSIGEQFKVLPAVIDVDELCLFECAVDDFSFCSNVKSLTILQGFKQSREVLNFEPLRNIERGIFSLDMWECSNYHLLRNLKSLEISFCSVVTDVSCFQNITARESNLS